MRLAPFGAGQTLRPRRSRRAAERTADARRTEVPRRHRSQQLVHSGQEQPGVRTVRGSRVSSSTTRATTRKTTSPPTTRRSRVIASAAPIFLTEQSGRVNVRRGAATTAYCVSPPGTLTHPWSLAHGPPPAAVSLVVSDMGAKWRSGTKVVRGTARPASDRKYRDFYPSYEDMRL